jgi:RNA polymerase sigma-70 factor, ECF subfamily
MSAPLDMTWNTPEDQLITRCRAGDREAFALVYAQYERLVLHYAYRMLGHSEDARDVCQETFVRAFQSMPNFRGESSLQTWLLKICLNLCRNRNRSRGRETPLENRDVERAFRGEAAYTDPHTVAEQRQQVEVMQSALSSLPPAQRELIILREYEELSCEEIAGILDCAVVTVRVKLFRARARLRERVHRLLASGVNDHEE